MIGERDLIQSTALYFLRDHHKKSAINVERYPMLFDNRNWCYNNLEIEEHKVNRDAKTHCKKESRKEIRSMLSISPMSSDAKSKKPKWPNWWTLNSVLKQRYKKKNDDLWFFQVEESWWSSEILFLGMNFSDILVLKNWIIRRNPQLCDKK